MRNMTFDDYLEIVLPHATRPESPDHGVEHWQRVAVRGAALAAQTPGADPDVVAAFAALHDSQRQNEFADPRHGLRAAMVLIGIDLGLTREQRVKLVVALVGHDEGRTSDDPTIGVCWDADRLDLPRVGIIPDPDLLSTDAAREFVARMEES
jgi:uncharacterized protein